MINPKLKQVHEVGDGATVNDLVRITKGNTVYYDGKMDESFSNLAYKINVCKCAVHVNKVRIPYVQTSPAQSFSPARRKDTCQMTSTLSHSKCDL